MLPGVMGLFLAVFAFDALLPLLQELGIRRVPQSITLPLLLGLPFSSLAVIMGSIFLLVVLLADKFDPAREEGAVETTLPLRKEWGWLAGGIITGLIILAASWQGEYLGISGGFAALTAYMVRPLGISLRSLPILDDHTLWRAAMVVGLVPGAFISAILAKAFRPISVTPLWQTAFSPAIWKRSLLVFLGGFLLGLGAYIGGGCTTGAFLAGWPTLSLGSFYMGMVFFGAAMATAHILYWGKWALISQVRASGIDLATD